MTWGSLSTVVAGSLAPYLIRFQPYAVSKLAEAVMATAMTSATAVAIAVVTNSDMALHYGGSMVILIDLLIDSFID